MDYHAIARAAELLRVSRHIVALTGAGISRPSGIPDFRSAGGLWAHDDPMAVASLAGFRADPRRFYSWV
nr:NAD-dependent deacylase [Chloroflexota bacterium]